MGKKKAEGLSAEQLAKEREVREMMDEILAEAEWQRMTPYEKIQAEVTDVMGGLILADTWLTEGWDGTLDQATYVMPDLMKAVTAAKEAMDRIFELAGVEVEKAA